MSLLEKHRQGIIPRCLIQKMTQKAPEKKMLLLAVVNMMRHSLKLQEDVLHQWRAQLVL
jgi:hypothetical protein